MQQEKEFYTLGEQGFWNKFLSKFLFSIISVKVWGLVTSMGISTWLLLIHNNNVPYEIGENVFERGINGAQWVTFNTTIWALIFGMKEVYRITERKDKTEMEALDKQAQNKQVLTTILADSKNSTTSNSRFRSDGTEVVGDEPDSK